MDNGGMAEGDAEIALDALVVGAGFAGLRALWGLREKGFRTRVIEASDEIGGVWNFNRYPGARCDVESFDYSYRFSEELEQDWRWSERYARQPEILAYINHVADRFDLRNSIDLSTRLESARYCEKTQVWIVSTGSEREYRARYLILAMGQLSRPKNTIYPGQENYRGRVLYSATWPRDGVDLSGKRVAIIGTGSSGVQMTPIVAEQAEHLSVFQRTANYSIPAANAPVTDEEDAEIKANYRQRRKDARNSPSGLGFIPNGKSALDVTPEEREREYEKAWHKLGFGFALTYKDILLDLESNRTASEFIQRKIAAKVHDPVLREKLTPQGFPFGTRRPSVDDGFYETFNRDNVALVDLAETPIVEFYSEGIRTSAAEIPFDVVVYATGFDTFTGSLLAPAIIGRHDVTLAEKWEAGPVTQLGLAVNGFPNMFIVGGPGSPSLLSNVLLSSEEQLDWLADLLVHAREHGIGEIEADEAAERAWVEHVNERAAETLYLMTPSYYVGAEMPGKPRVFMPYSGGVRYYRRIIENVAAEGYSGFTLR
ncbi:phenylacetone monooxygenase (plasmid) [Sphingopyxis sp. FD7]|nr:phenylacetone monooxygenase [Sphingopyxis sp. FD7]